MSDYNPPMPPIPRKVGPWRVTGTRELNRTPWHRIREDQLLWPNDKPASWVVVEFKPAVGVVAVDDNGIVHLVGQHRYAVDRFEWEIPEGVIDAGEEPIEAAKRELREETGLSASKWTSLGSTHPHNSTCDLTYHMFLAEGLSHGDSDPEPTEILSHKTMPFTDLLDLVRTSAILDCLTVVAVYRAWHHLNRPR